MRSAYLLTLLAVACANPADTPDGIQFAAERASYVPGDTVHIILRNSSPTPIGYNLCLAVLERSTADGWTPEPRWPPDTFCPAVLQVLHPGVSTEEWQPLLATTPAGVYRLRTDVEWPPDARHVTLTTAAFEILGQ